MEIYCGRAPETVVVERDLTQHESHEVLLVYTERIGGLAEPFIVSGVPLVVALAATCFTSRLPSSFNGSFGHCIDCGILRESATRCLERKRSTVPIHRQTFI